jgi:starch phosphorylase
MKAVFNGVLNCSVLDGWWAEMYENEVGWAIPTADIPDPVQRDDEEAHHLHRLLQDVIAPRYYQGPGDALPTAWLDRIRSSMAILGPQVSADRMLREYVECYYEPAAARSQRLRADSYKGARELLDWKQRTSGAWEDVAILSASTEPETPLAGQGLTVHAEVRLGSLQPDEVAVELLHGGIDSSTRLTDPITTRMHVVAEAVDGVTRFRATVTPSSGPFGFTIRAVPDHPELDHASWTGCSAWLAEEPA